MVETPTMVGRATAFESRNLRFFTDTAQALRWLGKPDAVFSSGTLQFTAKPEAYLEELCATGAETMIWERVQLSDAVRREDIQVTLLSENGPGFVFSRKRVEYQTIRIPERAFLNAHHGYSLAQRSGSQNDRAGEDFLFLKGRMPSNPTSAP